MVVPVESPWHHVVVNQLPLPPKVHWTVQLQDNFRPSDYGEEDVANGQRCKATPGHRFITLRHYLAVVTVRQYPVLLRRVEEQAQDVEVNGMLFKGCTFIWADEHSALYLRVAEDHYLEYRERGEGCSIREKGEVPSFGSNLLKNLIRCRAGERRDQRDKRNKEIPTFCLLVGQT